MTGRESTEPLDPARQPYDPTVLDLAGSRADVVWLRAMGITNVPERLTALLAEVDRLAEALTAEQARFDNLCDESARWTRESAERYLVVVAERDAERARVQRVEAGPIAEIADQRARNHAKWGERSIENRQPDYAGWLPTLGEEFGEVCRAQTLEDASKERLRSELIDTAAVALMWIDSIDRAALAGDTEVKP